MSFLLFSPGQINRIRFKNRILMAPMHLGYCKTGLLNDEEIEFYIKRARGGAAAVSFSAAVNEDGRLPGMPSLEDDACTLGLKKLAQSVNEYDCRTFVQLFHCGRNDRKGEGRKGRLLAPSPVPSPIFRQAPEEMTKADLEKVKADFASAAKRCRAAGVDGVEISCSAGYLLSEFLSPLTNRRTDGYGGSLEHRMRFPLEVIAAVRAEAGPDYMATIRISAFDMLEGGYTLSDMQEFCIRAQQAGIDAVDVTGGWHESPVPQISYQLPEGGFAPLAGAIKSVLDIPVIASNRLHGKKIGEQVLEAGFCDFINVGRPLLTDPEYVNKLFLGKPVNTCISCNKGCITRVLRGLEAHCVFNPGLSQLSYSPVRTGTKKRVLVIGAGPAGVTCAAHLAERGFEVTLAEREDSIGGKTVIASRLSGKNRIGEFIPYAEELLADCHVEVWKNTVVDGAFIQAIDPDYVVVAAGANPVSLPIEGLNETNRLFAQDILSGKVSLESLKTADHIVVAGGGAVGLETALFIAKHLNEDLMPSGFSSVYVSGGLKGHMRDRRRVIVVEKAPKAGEGLGVEKTYLLQELKYWGAEIYTNATIGKYTDGQIEINTDQGTILFNRSALILAAGYRPGGQELLQYLRKNNLSFSVIGDAKEVGTLKEAFEDGFQEALRISI